MDIKELLTPDFAITWLPWAVQYFFLIGLAYTSVWIAAIAVLWPGQRQQRLLTLCGSLIFSAAIVAPVALLADLHQPLRAGTSTCNCAPIPGCGLAPGCCRCLWAQAYCLAICCCGRHCRPQPLTVGASLAAGCALAVGQKNPC